MKWTIWFFGACALLTLGVSIPATYAALRLWHDAGGAGGWVLVVFALLVFEIGAVGAKLATLAIPEWRGRLTALTVGLLAVTTGANYAHGYDLSQAADAAPTLAAILNDPVGAVIATLVSAALFPALLFVFLSAFVSRCETLAAGRDTPARFRRVVARLRQRAASARHELAAVRQTVARGNADLATLRQELATATQALAEAQQELARRPAPREIDVVYVARYRLTWQQFEQAVRQLSAEHGVSLTTIRRRVADIGEPLDRMLEEKEPCT